MKQDKPAQIAFLVYFLVTMSKRLWLPSLSGAYFWIADFFCFVCLPALLIAVFKLPIMPTKQLDKEKSKFLEIGSLLYLSFLTALGLWLLNIIGGVIGVKIVRYMPDVIPRVIDYASHIPKTGALSVLVVFYFSITAGYVEEYFFRGLLRLIIGDNFRYGQLLFVTISATSFAMIHWGGGLVNLVAAFMQGILLAIVLVRTGNIRVVMLGHSLFWLKWLF
jgi:membrane protease YdiL (CAAX protease family)